MIQNCQKNKEYSEKVIKESKSEIQKGTDALFERQDLSIQDSKAYLCIDR